MEYVKGHGEFACAIAKALGMDPGTVKRIVIDIAANDVVKVYVDKYLSTETAGVLADCFRREGKPFKVEELNPNCTIDLAKNGIEVSRD